MLPVRCSTETRGEGCRETCSGAWGLMATFVMGVADWPRVTSGQPSYPNVRRAKVRMDGLSVVGVAKRFRRVGEAGAARRVLMTIRSDRAPAMLGRRCLSGIGAFVPTPTAGLIPRNGRISTTWRCSASSKTPLLSCGVRGGGNAGIPMQKSLRQITWKPCRTLHWRGQEYWHRGAMSCGN